MLQIKAVHTRKFKQQNSLALWKAKPFASWPFVCKYHSPFFPPFTQKERMWEIIHLFSRDLFSEHFSMKNDVYKELDINQNGFLFHFQWSKQWEKQAKVLLLSLNLIVGLARPGYIYCTLWMPCLLTLIPQMHRSLVALSLHIYKLQQCIHLHSPTPLNRERSTTTTTTVVVLINFWDAHDATTV